MWNFITQNSDGLNTVVNALMLLVWAFYFQLLLNSHRRQKRPRILINRSAGQDLSANCIISNMSAEPVYLECIVMKMYPGDHVDVSSLTDLDTLTKRPGDDPRKYWFQGPLTTGDYLTLGTFEELLKQALSQADENGEQRALASIESFELMAIATYGPDTAPVAAKRRFEYDRDARPDDRWKAGPVRPMRSLWHRRELRGYLRENA